MVEVVLSERLEENGMTPEELSEETGIQIDVITALCNGSADEISLEHLDILCETLDCDITDIISQR